MTRRPPASARRRGPGADFRPAVCETDSPVGGHSGHEGRVARRAAARRDDMVDQPGACEETASGARTWRRHRRSRRRCCAPPRRRRGPSSASPRLQDSNSASSISTTSSSVSTLRAAKLQDELGSGPSLTQPISPSKVARSLRPATSSVIVAGNDSLPAIGAVGMRAGDRSLDLALRVDADHLQELANAEVECLFVHGESRRSLHPVRRHCAAAAGAGCDRSASHASADAK